MLHRRGVAALAFAAVIALPAAAHAVDIVPHRAIYTMTLERAQNSSGVVAAKGSMLFQWADSCDGWTIEQRYRLTMQYSEQGDSELVISFVTWEAKDGLRYRFNVKKLRDGEPNEELRGDAVTNEKGGQATFVKPQAKVIVFPPGTIFPTAHTILLIERAIAGDTFLSRKVFDGGTAEGPFDVTAGIGALQEPDPNAANPLLRNRWWPVRLAFFPADSQDPQPDYEFGMDLQDNGIARGLILDYGNFVIRAKLDTVEALPKPAC